MRNEILTDVDGVLLDWQHSFDSWMINKGYTKYSSDSYDLSKLYDVEKDDIDDLIQEFNESTEILQLNPLRDAQVEVKILLDKGYKLHAITSLGSNPKSKRYRELNLEKIFGKNAFYQIDCLGFSESKHDFLKQYENTNLPWFEDKPKNCVIGHDLGLKSYLFNHSYNADFEHDGIEKIDLWKEFTDKTL